MKMPLAILLTCLPFASSWAQAPLEHPAYVRLGLVLPDNDFRHFLGGKSLASLPLVEIGYTYQPNALVGWNLFGQFLDLKGDPISDYAGLQHRLKARRIGAEARYRTPLDRLSFFGGIVMGRFDGRRLTPGVVPNYGNPAVPYQLPARDLDESNWKFGARFGFEYALTPHWGLTVDYSYSEWFTRVGGLGLKPSETGGAYFVKGVNPVNPKWYGISAQYRFDPRRK